MTEAIDRTAVIAISTINTTAIPMIFRRIDMLNMLGPLPLQAAERNASLSWAGEPNPRHPRHREPASRVARTGPRWQVDWRVFLETISNSPIILTAGSATRGFMRP